jgi:hypothetical protein
MSSLELSINRIAIENLLPYSSPRLRSLDLREKSFIFTWLDSFFNPSFFMICSILPWKIEILCVVIPLLSLFPAKPKLLIYFLVYFESKLRA